MPIVARKAHQPAEQPSSSPVISPRPRQRHVPQVAAAASPLAEAKKQRRGHATRDETGKWQPTGDYEVGFGRAPVATRFDGKPGPGRPKGSISYEALLKKHLLKKRKLTIEGRQQTVTHAELILMASLKDAALGNNRDARRHALAEIARTMTESTGVSAQTPHQLNASDALSLAEFEQDIREQVLADLLEKPGEQFLAHTEEGSEP